MYSETVAGRRLARMVDSLRAADPTFDPKETSQELAQERSAALAAIRSEDGSLTRPLKPEEERWILNELTLSKASFKYWATRYARIKTKEAEAKALFPLFESQQIILDRIGRIEEQCISGERLDGVLVAILKARQLGASTLSEAMLGHRAFLYGNTTALIAADVPAQSAYLYNMLERIYDNLPWWMKPEQKYREKESQLFFERTDSLILVESGKSVRGGATLGQERGQMGRGKTFPLAHLSEISTWENAAQIDDALMPAIPRHHRTLAIFESTARGRGNEWHDMWLVATKGIGRVVPIFIPWYGESHTYIARAPEGWEPTDLTKAHAERAREVSAKWCGRTIELNRDQLYWWETERAAAKEKRKLHIFLAEYCVAAGTRVSTARGIAPIEEVIADGVAGEHGPVSRRWDNGRKPVFEVRTQQGRSLHATGNHRVFLADSSERRVDDLQQGDELQLSAPLLASELASIQWQPIPAIQATSQVDVDMGRFLGYFMGDGCYHNGRVSVACDAQDTDVLDDVAALLAKITGRRPSRSTRGKNGGCCTITSHHRMWKPLLHAAGALKPAGAQGGWKRHVCVPSAILKSPQPVVTAFLSALFECDGHGRKDCVRTTLSAASGAFLRDVQLLLLAYGINSSIRRASKVTEERTYQGHLLSLGAAATDIFHESIGFLSHRKRTTAKHGPSAKGRPRLPNTLTDTVVAVEPAGKADVCDLAIANGHQYGANGILVHNCADPSEAFQNTGQSVFPFEVLHDIRQRLKAPDVICEIQPKAYLEGMDSGSLRERD